MAEVILRGVSKVYQGNVVAVNNVNMEVKDREFAVLVGPSGCGKSTTLRMVAGLEEITSGDILIDGRIVNGVSPKDRDISMVFQNYALYPHMTVYENMSFGLKMRKQPKKDIEERVAEAAKILEIEKLMKRYPKELSGGQKQRVAVGRAIVRKPKVFLFDEPLSNLDAKLRVQMRAELSKLHKRLNATIMYVTHDQMEAMTMGDKIVVMKDGVIQQTGSPLTLYNSPVNKFVAGFIGSPATNFINGRILKQDSGFVFSGAGIKLLMPREFYGKLAGHENREVFFGIRPECISPCGTEPDRESGRFIKAIVEVVETLGAECLVHLNISGEIIIAKFDVQYQPETQKEIGLTLNMEKTHIFDKESEMTIV